MGMDTPPSKKKFLAFAGVLLLLPVLALGPFDLRQSIAITIIALFITSTFLFWSWRLSFGFLGIATMLIFRVLDIPHFIRFASLDIIVFLIGMMIVVGYLERSHFFEFVIGRLLAHIGRSGKLLLVALLALAALSAALVDSVMSILIMTSIVIHVAEKYRVKPIPLVLMTVFATNIGSSATVVGNPVGVLVALNGKLSFFDFLRWATPISVVSLAAGIGMMMLIFRKEFAAFDKAVRSPEGDALHEASMTGAHLRTPSLLFGGVMLGLILHSQFEKLLGLEKNTLLIGIALIGAGIAMMLSRDGAQELLERRVDWWTLMFFMFLFASVGALEYTGAIDILSGSIAALTSGQVLLTMAVIMVVAGLLSAVLDNVLAVAIMSPIIQHLQSTMPLAGTSFWWVMLFAATFFGNLTFIGSTANIVALGVLQKRHLGHISFREWLGPGLAVTLVTAAVALAMIAVQLPLMGG